MSEYVWCTQDLLLADGHYHVRVAPGEVWWADDPLVLHRPEFFSATPLTVRSTAGRVPPGVTPVTPPSFASGGVVPAPVVTLPTTVAVTVSPSTVTDATLAETLQAAVRRGRPRKDASRG